MRRLAPLVLSFLAACSSAATDDGAPSTPGADTTVYDECVAFATELCADAQGCCSDTYGGFDRDACVATFKRDVCRPGADAVSAHRADFDEDAVAGCLLAQAEAHRICVPTWSQTLELRKKIGAACRVIDGRSPPGSGCSTSATCKRPDGNGSVECIKNACTVIEVLAEGAPCSFPSGPVSVCDEGLTCDAPGLGATGHCVPAPQEGEACDASALESTDCGLGRYCDVDSATCKVTDNFAGPGCSQSTECVSFECDRIANTCAPAPAVLSRETCLGDSD
ncbi:MAG: hypothetical protein EOO73_35550 [Myxococcales bacterium]|nr:MAG: hypothetical protein EOO73_35550 [Myxococcales bacterium]